MVDRILALLSFAFTLESGSGDVYLANPSASGGQENPPLDALRVCRRVNINLTPSCSPPPRVGLELIWMSEGNRRKGMADLHDWSDEHEDSGVLAVFADAVANKAVILAEYTLPGFLWLQGELDDVATIPVEIRPPCRPPRRIERLRDELVRLVRRSRPALALFAADIDLRFGGIRVLLPYGEESLGAWLKAYFGDEVLIHYREPLPDWFTSRAKRTSPSPR